MISIGEIIKQDLEAQERTITWLAGKLCLDRSNIYRLFKKNSIDTDLLMRVSTVLNRNYFDLFSQEFNERQISQHK